MEHSRFSSPKKRRMSDFQEDYSAIIRSPDVWLDDGDVIIQAETVQFRVKSNSFQQWQCPTFYKLFIEGRAFDVRDDPLSVIYVPEKAQEWRDLLMHYYKLYLGWYSMDRTISLMRLSRKYDFGTQESSMTNRLRTIVPCTDIWSWDDNDLSDLSLAGKSMYVSGWEFHMVNCFEEVGMQTVLPAMYFVILRDVGLEKVMTGQRHPSGETVSLSRATQKMLISAFPKLIKLSMELTELTPRRLLQEAHDCDHIVCEAYGEAPSSSDADDIYVVDDEASEGDTDTMATDMVNDTDSTDTISCAARSKASDEWLLRLACEPGLALRSPKEEISARCEPCNDFIKPIILDGRMQIWKALPEIFGLPPWEQMTDYQDTIEDVGQN